MRGPNTPATARKEYVPHDCKQYDFSSGTLESPGISNIPALWLSTNLEMILIFLLRIWHPLFSVQPSKKGDGFGQIPGQGRRKLQGFSRSGVNEAERGRMKCLAPHFLKPLPEG